tara:strand:+ start:11564 stop:11794 length:231 start_codon:yes stop_codon:yes gene_type:complete
MTHQTEKTPEGVQVLVTGVRPVTDRDRLAMLAARPLAPAKPQNPLNIGLFDEDARRQLDLTDLLRASPARNNETTK